MKNFDLLPLDDIQMQRVKKFAEMHQRFGGIVMDVIAFDKGLDSALIRIIDKKGKLSPEELAAKANEVFVNEVPSDLVLYYTIMEEDSKFYLTWDKQFVVRVHDYFKVWPATELVLQPTKPVSIDRIVGPTPPETVKAIKWLKNYLITHQETI